MNSTASTTSSNTPSYSALAEENALLREQLQVMQRQLDWFKKQLFGPKSEKQVFDLPGQDSLFASDDAPVPAQPPKNEKRTVKAYQRGTGKKQRDDDCLNDTGLRFTADVPVEVIEHLPPELTGPEADQYEVIGSKTTFRLAQRASSYVVLKCERPVFRRKGTEKPITTPAPFNV
ncbi:IS66 family transposase, partial [Halomonas sp. 141]|uniref:IS66 family transposase n=1 Tax=Halomonas sp. 141 TaxID=2056666 RepID=UPI00406C0E5D